MITRQKFIRTLCGCLLFWAVPARTATTRRETRQTSSRTMALYRILPTAKGKPSKSFLKFSNQRRFASVAEAVAAVKNPTHAFRVVRIST
jgi:hypothetical protein